MASEINLERMLELKAYAEALGLRNGECDPEKGWRLNDILGAPMRAGVEFSAEPTPWPSDLTNEEA